MPWQLAQLNVARLTHPLGAPHNAEFVAVLDAVNTIAEVSPGFVWRLTDSSGRPSSYITATDDPHMIVNLTVWDDVASLRHFTYRSGHGAYFRRRREWFEPSSCVNMVCWWIPAGDVPPLTDAMARLERLRTSGPSDAGFMLAEPLDPPL